MSKRAGKYESTIEEIRVSDLEVDPSYQTGLNVGWIKKTAPHFDRKEIRIITVSIRADGKRIIVDGQHRVALMIELGLQAELIRCEVFKGLSVAEEAHKFLILNNNRSKRPLDRYRAALVAGEPEAVGIDRILRKLGLKASDQNGAGYVRGIAHIQRIYRGARIANAAQGAHALETTLTIMRDAWGMDHKNFKSAIIEGLGLILLRFKTKVDVKVMVEKLTSVAPSKILQGAVALKEVRHKSESHVVAEVIVTIYNKNRRARKLPEWK